MVVDYSNLSLTRKLCSKVGSCPKTANFHSFTDFDSGLQIRTKRNSEKVKYVRILINIIE